MRSNLLSLQNIARQQDIVQNRLATGLKVSSAIDNPSSYYTAASLSNRAADLTALLDAMSQGVQTIKTASEAIDAGIKFLEQAKAVANQAPESPYALKEKEQIDYSLFHKLDKSWYEAQVGKNGAVVETAQELLDAVNTGKEIIVVYGKINMENRNIFLQEGQKLVGTEYFADIDSNALYRLNPNERFSQIHFKYTGDSGGFGVTTVGNNIISDLKITQENEASLNRSAVYVMNAGNSLKNLDIDYEADSSQSSGIIVSSSGDDTKISGIINISVINRNSDISIGIYNYGGELFIDQAEINVPNGWRGILGGSSSHTHISNSILNLQTTYGLYTNHGGYGGNTININENVILNCRSISVMKNSESSVENSDTGKVENIINIKKGTQIYWQNTQNGQEQSLITLENINSHTVDKDFDLDDKAINEFIEGGQVY